jgi:hypothetical protein
MGIQDLYKLLYQAAMGSEHAVGDIEAARRRLDRELASLGQESEDPLLERISPAGDLVRVNLRPYRQAGGDPEILLQAFVGSAEEHRGSIGRLEDYLLQAVRMAEEGLLPFDAGELAAWITEMRGRGWPAVSHSSSYRSLYQPAYRVVLTRLIESEVGKLIGSGDRAESTCGGIRIAAPRGPEFLVL